MAADFDPDQDYTIKEMLATYIIPTMQRIEKKVDEHQTANDKRFVSLETWMNRGKGVLAFIVLFVIPIALVPAAYAVYTAASGG